MQRHRMARHRLGAFTIIIMAGCVRPAPDLVLLNGHIITLKDDGAVEAMAVTAGTISAIGTSRDIQTLATPTTTVIDLGGRTVIPGLADNHYHGIGGGPGVDLSQARTLADVVTSIGARTAEVPAGQVVTTNSNWHEGQLIEQRLPLRDDLDRATVHHPVVVVRGGHEYILNSAALERWGITSQVESPPGGRIGRYPDGRLNGELVDQAKSFVTLPPPDPVGREDRITALVREHQTLNRHGLTTIRYAGVRGDLYDLLREMQVRDLLSIRVRLLFRLPGSLEPEDVDAALDGLPAGRFEGDDWLRVDGIKLGVDGGFEGGWMRDPYEGPWSENGTYYGLQTVPSDRYTGVVRALNRRGWRVATHAVGDAAIDLVLDAYRAANLDTDLTDRRFVIEHGFIPRDEQFDAMRELGLVVSAQNHLYLAAPTLVKYWGHERAAWTTPIRAYREAGIPVSSGTDSPVVPFQPFWTLYHFATRGTISAGILDATQRVGRLDALRLATEDNAFLTFDEDRRGRLAVGMQADFAVLDRPYLTVPDDQLEDTEVLMTVVGGRIVHRSSW